MSLCATISQFLLELLSFVIVRTFDTVKYLFHQGFRDGRQRVPPLRDAPFLQYSATKLAKMVRKGELTSEVLVTAAIARIREVDPLLNAVVEDRFEAALRDARRADQELASFGGDLDALAKARPFLGVPFTVKDCIGIKGMLADVGNESRRNERADEDAVLVRRLVAAGGIPLAITNVCEMCFWIESGNHVHGRTNNPHDLHRTSGGSSGGEAALISTYASVWGVGTDITGSIRLPAAWCGLFGHKPTPGFVSRQGVLPHEGQDLKARIGVAGPLARSADDLIAMMRIIADDPSKLRLDDSVDVSRLRYYFCDHEGSSFISSVQPEVRKQVHRVVNFVKNDLNVEPKPMPKPERISRHEEFWFATLAALDFPPLKSCYEPPEKAWEPLPELMRHIGGMSTRSICAIVISLLDDFYRRDPDKCRKSCEDLEQFKQDMNALLQDDGVLVMPSSVSVAPFHHGTLCNPVLYLGFASIVNVLKLPSTVVPMGYDSRGLPLSVQIVAGYGQDRLTLAVARRLEEKFGGFVPPCKVSVVNGTNSSV